VVAGFQEIEGGICSTRSQDIEIEIFSLSLPSARAQRQLIMVDVFDFMGEDVASSFLTRNHVEMPNDVEGSARK